jgi:hypothetical protein
MNNKETQGVKVFIITQVGFNGKTTVRTVYDNHEAAQREAHLARESKAYRSIDVVERTLRCNVHENS